MSNRPAFWTMVFAVASIVAASPAHAVLTWDFDVAGDDGLSADGWADTRGASTATGGGFIPSGGRTAATGGGGIAHNSTHTSLVFSSPLINIVGTGSLNVDLTGGQGFGDSAAGAFPANLADIPVNSTPTKDSNGWMLFSLRRASDDAYVFHFQRPTQADQWATYNLDLSAFAGNGVGYHLDLIESFNGNWGHLSIDDVSVDAVLAVPEPAAISLLALAIPMLVRGRRRAELR
jgi:hypothetical protein